MDFIFKLTLAVYVLATGAYVVHLVKPGDKTGMAGRWLVCTGFTLHLASTLMRAISAGYTPITNLHEAFSFFALSIVGVFIFFERRYRLAILGSFVVPVALLMMAASAMRPADIVPLNPVLKSQWLTVHTVMAFLGYAMFTISFGAAVMFLIQQHLLKSKKFGPLYHKLPSLEVLDDINYRCLTFGFPLLTFAIISGAIWAETAWGTYWSWDPKETWSLITWFVYAALLHGRLTTGWRGRKAAILSIVGFAVLLFTFLGVSFLLKGLHSYV
jgi:cytochrome c-type biogenesis protein CcsB